MKEKDIRGYNLPDNYRGHVGTGKAPLSFTYENSLIEYSIIPLIAKNYPEIKS